MSYDPNNIFARIIRGELPCHKIYETDAILAFMDIMPRANGHCLVLPKAPSRNIFDVQPEDLAEVSKAVQIIAKAARKAFDADGITVQQFNEEAGGQVVFHLHVHVIPRFRGEPLKPHTGEMADPELLARNAEAIRRALDAA
ncbi:HIT family protein [Microvirga massiliensis]|uniref:HIT family protein n=1 Tax=Microvirga massiliensis TaxID=1033741 RepID=UPI00062B72E6|nr:HIT family protein [Microvirga massiliensis]